MKQAFLFKIIGDTLESIGFKAKGNVFVSTTPVQTSQRGMEAMKTKKPFWITKRAFEMDLYTTKLQT